MPQWDLMQGAACLIFISETEVPAKKDEGHGISMRSTHHLPHILLFLLHNSKVGSFKEKGGKFQRKQWDWLSITTHLLLMVHEADQLMYLLCPSPCVALNILAGWRIFSVCKISNRLLTSVVRKRPVSHVKPGVESIKTRIHYNAKDGKFEYWKRTIQKGSCHQTGNKDLGVMQFSLSWIIVANNIWVIDSWEIWMQVKKHELETDMEQ